MISAQVYQYLESILGLERTQVIGEYLQAHSCELILCKARKTKLGDFRVKGVQKRIKINNNLNPYRFTITLIHEIAHLKTYYEKGWRCKPHGEEWKNNYRQLLDIWRIEELFDATAPLKSLFFQEHKQPSTCSGTHKEKEAVLREYDVDQSGIQLGDLENGMSFYFKGVAYQKIKDRRTRSLCLRESNQKMYTIHQASQVELHIENTKK